MSTPSRLEALKNHLRAQHRIPSYDELPTFEGKPGCAWELWGRDDQLGCINLLTDDVVKRAAQEEIKSGRTICLNWPVNFPEKPMFKRKPPHIVTLARAGEDRPVRDDELHINTQSGTQWDGLRHFGILKEKVFYNGVPATSIKSGNLTISDPMNVNPDLIKLGIHNWAQHGICSRGVFIDLVEYFTSSGSPLPYDPMTSHGITVADLEACASKQGVQFRTGDILLLRVGFMKRFNDSNQEFKVELAQKKETFAGLEQTEDMRRFLWDNHFAAVASDQPALERWPPGEYALHETLLGLWGMPIGEFFDLEALSKVCAESQRYTFFFTSWPLNVLGGVGSPANAAAYF